MSALCYHLGIVGLKVGISTGPSEEDGGYSLDSLNGSSMNSNRELTESQSLDGNAS